MALSLCQNAIVGGKYRLDRLIGKGGMGEVWAAAHVVTRQRVAIKFLSGDTQINDDARRRFFREARAACAVQHPNVVVIHDVIEVEDQTPAIVMELFQGESLESKLAREGKLSVETTLRLLLPVVSAVGTAHSLGVVHRDIKPDNIFLAETAEGITVKVLDFGVAKLGPREDGSVTGALTSTGAMLGTPYYMSPEQAFGEKQIDHRADLWSLGIVMFRCLSGTLPTKADNIGQILKIIMTRSIPRLATVAPHVPEAVDRLVMQLLGYSPAERPADLRPVKQAMEGMLRIKTEDLAPPVIAATSLVGVATPALARPAAPRRRAAVYAVAGAAVFASLTAATLIGRTPSTAEPSAAIPFDAPMAELPFSPAPSSSATATPTEQPLVTAVASASAEPPVTARVPPKVPTAVAGGVGSVTAAPQPAATGSLGGIVDKPGY